jgi:GNAT superfamily N-acetyltransferase
LANFYSPKKTASRGADDVNSRRSEEIFNPQTLVLPPKPDLNVKAGRLELLYKLYNGGYEHNLNQWHDFRLAVGQSGSDCIVGAIELLHMGTKGILEPESDAIVSRFWVNHLWVNSVWRRKCVGGYLLEIAKYVAAQRYDHVYLELVSLDSSISLPILRRFYEKNGFKEISWDEKERTIYKTSLLPRESIRFHPI